MHYVLCYPIRRVRKKKEVLLGYMKRGLWQGYFNGFGGKMLEMVDNNVPKRYENIGSPAQCALRKLEEESGITAELGDIVYNGHVLFVEKKKDMMDTESLVDVFTIELSKDMDRCFPQAATDASIPCWFNADKPPLEMMPPFDDKWVNMVLNDRSWFSNYLHNYVLEIEEGELVQFTHTHTERKSRF